MAWPRLEHYFAPTSKRRRPSNPLPRQNLSPNSTSISASHSPTLRETAEETLSLLPGILSCRPDAQPRSYLSTPANTPPLSSPSSPPPQSNNNSQNPTRIRVLNADSIDAALSLPVPLHHVPKPNPNPNSHPKPPCILNMANGHHAGGGFLRGALAQEEALCYRTSLYPSLKRQYCPLPDRGAIYSPRILVIRRNLSQGHALLDLTKPEELAMLSVVSVAAVCRPDLLVVQADGGSERYAHGADARLMQEKMRTVLRVAAGNGHGQIVLGAFGCGAFGNPGEEVAGMWKGVLLEREFEGGLWDDVVFAVLDNDGRGNFDLFRERLEGVAV